MECFLLLFSAIWFIAAVLYELIKRGYLFKGSKFRRFPHWFYPLDKIKSIDLCIHLSIIYLFNMPLLLILGYGWTVLLGFLILGGAFYACEWVDYEFLGGKLEEEEEKAKKRERREKEAYERRVREEEERRLIRLNRKKRKAYLGFDINGGSNKIKSINKNG